jgi:hypothetical protein
MNDICFVDGTAFPCLLDSGSQVTVITLSIFKALNRRLFPLSDLVLWHGGGGKIPYLGWTCIRLGLQHSFAGTKQQFDTLALVVPDNMQAKAKHEIIIGTNTGLFDHLRKACKQAAGVRYLQRLPIHSWCATIYRKAEKTSKLGADGFLGLVRSKASVRIPAGATKCLQGSFRNPLRSQNLVLVDAPKRQLHGLVQTSYVTNIDETSTCKVTVEVTNITASDISIPANVALAEVTIPEAVSHPQGHLTKLDATCAASNVTNEHSDSSRSSVHDLPFVWGPDISPEQKESILKKFEERSDVFAKHDWDLGMTTQVHHEINLNDETPFRERTRRISPADLRDLQQHIQELLDHGIIRESKSRYASPIVLVRKKNGSLRMCVDYRILNTRSVPDQYTVPLIRDAVDCLSGSSWFSVIDLKSGFYQIPMREEDKEKTAFTCPVGFYEFQRMPQGIKGAPATFQRLMETCMSGLNFLEVLVYMDDVIVFAKTYEEMEARLLKVLDRLQDCGLKVSPEKCQLFCRSVKYLGHIVSEAGIQTDPEKVSAVTNWPRPTMPKNYEAS